jgi:periplasmic mercuric ion binding protein
MRTIFLVCFTIISLSTLAQDKTTTFKVSGNCSSCKKHIETAARVDGVTKVNWNIDSKVLTLVYDPARVNPEDIQKRIAAVGYDTPKYRGDDKAYKALDECCQYDRVKM